MLEQEYLELSNQLKVKFEENERAMVELRREVKDMKKMIMTAYGLIRMIDWLSDSLDMPFELKVQIENARGWLSECIDIIRPQCIHINVENLNNQTSE